MSSTFLAWTRYNRRSDLLSQHFGATMHHIPRGQTGTVWNAPIRYARQSGETWQILRREKPDTIFVQNPPIICVLVAYLYARQHGARYVIDSHTAAFLSPKWRWALGLHRALSRGAVTTIVTNEALRQVVSGWGCHASVMGFT
ncbi:MAG TPA: glycosyltransferase, partial [Chloroflexota bacterium]|nr:glycosyltransferase [Chloroflexota bacterium]